MIDKLTERKYVNTAYSSAKNKGFLSTSTFLTIGIFLILFVLAKAVLAYSQYATPGQVLHPLKLASENVKLKFSQHPRDTAVLYGLFLQERLVEIKKLALNPSPVFLEKAQASIGVTENTVNEILAGIFTGDVYFEPNTADALLESISQFNKTLISVAENIDDKTTLQNIEILTTKIDSLHSQLVKIAESDDRTVRL